MKTLALAAAFLVLGTGTAFAQSCATPTGLTSGETITNSAGLPTTCGGDTSFTDICGGGTLTGPSHVYSWTYSTGTPSGNITVTPAGATTFDPAIAIVGPAASCASAVGTCVQTSDTPTPGGAESVALSAANTAGVYYLVISSFSTTIANQCGPYGLTVGTLPVKLQSFEIN